MFDRLSRRCADNSDRSRSDRPRNDARRVPPLSSTVWSPGRSSQGVERRDDWWSLSPPQPIGRQNRPSSSAAGWGVYSFSSLPDDPTLPRCPTASISSMKMIAGARLCAASNRSHTLEAPAPTNISTNLDPVTARNGTLEFAGTALASSVFRSREVPPSAHPEDRWPRPAQSVMGT